MSNTTGREEKRQGGREEGREGGADRKSDTQEHIQAGRFMLIMQQRR